MQGAILNQKICSEKLEEHKRKIETQLKRDKSYGGFEGKVEEGELVHYKHWVSKKT